MNGGNESKELRRLVHVLPQSCVVDIKSNVIMYTMIASLIIIGLTASLRSHSLACTVTSLQDGS